MNLFFIAFLIPVKITASILRKQNSVMTVSVMMNGEYGLSDVCLSVPSIVTDRGAVKIIEGSLPPQELEALRRSAGILREAIDSLSL